MRPEEGFSFLKSAPRVLGARDVPVPFSPVLETAYIPQPKDIARTAKEVCCGS